MKQAEGARVLLSVAAWRAILLDAYQRQRIEACGALLGRIESEGNWYVEEVTPLRNIYASPVYFEFDPAELLAIDLTQPGRMIGVYHSHPAGPVMASSTDRQNMRRVNVEQNIPWVWLIVSGPFLSRSTAGVTTDVERKDDEVDITLKGAIAYHHYRDSGLRQIAIQRSENEDARPDQRL